MASAVARAIGADHATTFDVSNACAGMFTGVMILNNWIRQGTVQRGLVVSGEYISQLGQHAARHIRNIMSKELASLTLGDAGAALLPERATARSGRISLAGLHHGRGLQPTLLARPSQCAARRGGGREDLSPACRGHPDEVHLLVNAGLYRDRNLGEPAVAAMIQDDIGANPEDPHPDAHGTFSFDVANGTCGILTALHVVDGFLRVACDPLRPCGGERCRLGRPD